MPAVPLHLRLAYEGCNPDPYTSRPPHRRAGGRGASSGWLSALLAGGAPPATRAAAAAATHTPPERQEARPCRQPPDERGGGGAELGEEQPCTASTPTPTPTPTPAPAPAPSGSQRVPDPPAAPPSAPEPPPRPQAERREPAALSSHPHSRSPAAVAADEAGPPLDTCAARAGAHRAAVVDKDREAALAAVVDGLYERFCRRAVQAVALDDLNQQLTAGVLGGGSGDRLMGVAARQELALHLYGLRAQVQQLQAAVDDMERRQSRELVQLAAEKPHTDARALRVEVVKAYEEEPVPYRKPPFRAAERVAVRRPSRERQARGNAGARGTGRKAHARTPPTPSTSVVDSSRTAATRSRTRTSSPSSRRTARSGSFIDTVEDTRESGSASPNSNTPSDESTSSTASTSRDSSASESTAREGSGGSDSSTGDLFWKRRAAAAAAAAAARQRAPQRRPSPSTSSSTRSSSWTRSTSSSSESRPSSRATTTSSSYAPTRHGERMYDPYGGAPRREDLDAHDTTFPATASSEYDLWPTFMSFRDIVLSKQSLNAQYPTASETSVKRWAKRAIARHTPASGGSGGGGGLARASDIAHHIALRPLLPEVGVTSKAPTATTTRTYGAHSAPVGGVGGRITIMGPPPHAPGVRLADGEGGRRRTRQHILYPRDSPYYAATVAKVAKEREAAAAAAAAAKGHGPSPRRARGGGPAETTPAPQPPAPSSP